MRISNVFVGAAVMFAGPILVTTFLIETPPTTPRTQVWTPDGSKLELLVADAAPDRARGLSNQPDLPLDGLLLLWPASGQHPIWMHEMNFPLDVIWCDDTGRVLAMKTDVQPCPASQDCPLYGATLPNTRAVIELRAGRIREIGLQRGDRLSITELTP